MMEPRAYPASAVERAMKVQEVILRTIDGRVKWYQAAERLGISDACGACVLLIPQINPKRTQRVRQVLSTIQSGRGSPLVKPGGDRGSSGSPARQRGSHGGLVFLCTLL
jgi:hypothetical protein